MTSKYMEKEKEEGGRTDDSHPDIFIEDSLHDRVVVARVGLCDDLPSQASRPARACGLHGVREADADARLVAVDDPDAQVARARGGGGEGAPVAVLRRRSVVVGYTLKVIDQFQLRAKRERTYMGRQAQVRTMMRKAARRTILKYSRRQPAISVDKTGGPGWDFRRRLWAASQRTAQNKEQQHIHRPMAQQFGRGVDENRIWFDCVLLSAAEYMKKRRCSL